MKKWLLHKLIRHVYHGITQKDFLDLTSLSEAHQMSYMRAAKNVLENETFKTEMARFRYKQERLLVNKATTEDDLVFGKAVLYTIEYMEKRFAQLANTFEVQDRETDLS